MKRIIETKDKNGNTIYQLWQEPEMTDEYVRQNGECLETGIKTKADAEKKL